MQRRSITSKHSTEKHIKTVVTKINADPGRSRISKNYKKTGITPRRGVGAPVIASQEEVRVAVDALLANAAAMAFLRKNVSKWSVDVLNTLITPKTDEYIAEKLGIKINAARRILNLLQTHGITNYYVAKNDGGWLSFAWYINTDKIQPFFDFVSTVANKKTVVNNDCNDYFVCNDCYQRERLIFTFDAAFEAAFRCNCGNDLSRIGKLAAEKLVADTEQSLVDQSSGITNNVSLR